MSTTRIEYDDLDLIEGDYGYEYVVDGKPFTGIAYILNPNGQLYSETEFVDGYPKADRGWYPSGQLEKEKLYRTIYGSTHEWFENGRIRQEITREHGIVTSQRIWDEMGNLVHEYNIGEHDPNFSSLSRSRERYSRWLAHKDEQDSEHTNK
jgi:hypothetical protein